jgi:hypothetical protein
MNANGVTGKIIIVAGAGSGIQVDYDSTGENLCKQQIDGSESGRHYNGLSC